MDDQQSSSTFIIVRKEPKTHQIETIDLDARGLYAIKYRKNVTIFHYRPNDVVFLKNPVRHDPLHCKVYTGGWERHDVVGIQSFQEQGRRHWRIKCADGRVQDYMADSGIRVVESCLSDEIAKNSFEYLKCVAQINNLGKDEEHGGILSSLYEAIDFLDDGLAVAPYLNPAKYSVRRQNVPALFFPFGSNASQQRAVNAAFEHQISVIQGPPGTGKTQTILNIIANILIQGKTVMVVSNNNSATANVFEKLQKNGFGFVVAPLGRKKNKEEFIANQPTIPNELQTWHSTTAETAKNKRETVQIIARLQQVYAWQEELAASKQTLKAMRLEWEHFKQDNQIGDDTYKAKRGVKSQRLMSLWLRYQAYAEGDVISPRGFFGRLRERITWAWLNLMGKYLLGIKAPFCSTHLQPIIQELQALYYHVRIDELQERIDKIESELTFCNAASLSSALTSLSMALFKGALYDKYHHAQRRVYVDTKELWQFAESVSEQFPVVLSTTFSARTALPKIIYDYIIMDEASQVSVETGALALTCARNAVIVGDALQLPNVVTNDNRQNLDTIFAEYKVHQGYNSAVYSFLQSVCVVLPKVRQTLLREHYRCHPKIINFCNQRFYGGNLLMMTDDHDEENVMTVVKTKPGNHSRICTLSDDRTSKLNEREIDVIKEELLPSYAKSSDIGIITPYNGQVVKLHERIPQVEAATIHKYQGREKDTIIMSVVDDQISDFSDNANLLNVAISRAKKHFCLVVTGNGQERNGNITELIDYVGYHNFSIIESKVSSIFDYLYSQYTKERIAFLSSHKNISVYDSENLTYSLLESIIQEYPQFSHLGTLCHTPVRVVIHDWSLLDEEERRYASHYGTHLDFLIINHVTKKPVMAIETDGYSFHHDGTEQHQRDLLKNRILEKYGLPLMRLSTTGSGEKEKVVAKLSEILG